MNNQGMLKSAIMSKTLYTIIIGSGLMVVAPFVSAALNINVSYLSVLGFALVGFVMPECIALAKNRLGENSAKFFIAKDIMLITLCFSILAFNLIHLAPVALAAMGIFTAVFAVKTYLQHQSLKRKIEMQQVNETPEMKVVYIDAA